MVTCCSRTHSCVGSRRCVYSEIGRGAWRKKSLTQAGARKGDLKVQHRTAKYTTRTHARRHLHKHRRKRIGVLVCLSFHNRARSMCICIIRYTCMHARLSDVCQPCLLQSFVTAGKARHRRKSTAHQQAMELVECEPSVPLCASASVRE